MDETKMTAMPVNAQTLTELTRILQKYKAGKASIERRTVAAENWWKAAQSGRGEKEKTEGIGGFQAVSGWLHNVIVSKHADAIEAFPSRASCRARRETRPRPGYCQRSYR